VRLSSAGRYGVQAMHELAVSGGDVPLTGKEIARKNRISHAYLEQLLVKLRRSGLLRSVRGPGGGYVLARAPEEISAGEIIRAVEGPLALSKCFVGGGKKAAECARQDLCVSRILVRRLTLEITKVLDQITLADLRVQSGMNGTVDSRRRS